MKKIVKKLMAMMLTMTLVSVIFTTPSLVVHAVSPSELSVDRPGYGTATARAAIYVNGLLDINIVGYLEAGKEIMIVGEYGDLYVVQYDTTGKTGYIAKSQLYYEEEDYYLRTPYPVGATLYSNPDVNSKENAFIPFYTSFAYTSDAYGEWYRGVYGNAEGFALKQYVERIPFN